MSNQPLHRRSIQAGDRRSGGAAAGTHSPSRSQAVGRSAGVMAEMLEPRTMLSASDLTFNITYDSSIGTLSQAEQGQVMSSVNYIVSEYSGDFSVAYPTTVNINIAYDPDPTVLAENLPTLEPSYTYAQIRTALLAAAPGDASELPATDPTGGGTFQTTSAQAKALGLPLADSTSAIDGYVTFGAVPWSFYPSGSRAAPNDYDFTSGLEHEFSEVMGRLSDITPGGNEYTPFDLFRYSGPGVRSLQDLQTQSPDGNEVPPVAYFSLDNGSTNLRYFDNTVGDDIQDWNGFNHDSYDAEGLPDDSEPVSSLDIQTMDALGFDSAPITVSPTPTPTPTPTSTTPTPTPTPTTPTPTPTGTGPGARLTSRPETAILGSGTPSSFSVTYTDVAGLNAGSLGADDVVVVAPNGAAVPCTLASTTVVSPTEDDVTYTVSPPEVGEYQIDSIAGQVTDTAGNTASGQNLGTFDAVAASPAPTVESSPAPTGVVVVTPDQVTDTIPPEVTAGGRFRGAVTADLSESGAGAFEGRIGVALYASPTQSLTGATLISTETSPKLYLVAGQVKPVNFKVSTLPASLEAGPYFIVVQVDSAVGGALAESAGTVTVAPSSISLSGEFAALAGSVIPGRNTSAVLSLTNGGTVPAAGVLQITLYARPAATSGADLPLGTITVKIRIKPDGTSRVRLRYQVPSTLPPGNYALVAQLDPDNAFAQSSLAGPIVSSSIFTSL